MTILSIINPRRKNRLTWEGKISFQKGSYVILQNKSAKRFQKLYASFIAYANARLGLYEKAFDRFEIEADEKAYDVARAVWEKGQNTHLVADYVRDNPDKLSRTDLREVAQWENALAGIFTILSDGRDTLFNIPRYTLVVRGITEEIDTIIDEELPVLASTILLPFENVIIYACAIDTVPIERNEMDRLGSLTGLDVVKDANRTIRSTRDFLKYRDDLLATLPTVPVENADDESQQQSDSGLDTELGPDDEVKGQHRGTLAGLRGQERQEAEEKAREQNKDKTIATLFEGYNKFAHKRLPQKSIKATYTRSTKRELTALAKGKGVEGDIDAMSMQELLNLLLPLLSPTTEQTLATLRSRGTRTIEFAREIQEAGGRIELTKRDAIARGDLAPAAPPVFAYYAKGTKLVACMMDDYVRCLADVDWDEELEAAKRLEDAHHFFDTVAELRGVDVADEVVEEYLTYVGGAEHACRLDDLHDMVTREGFEGTAGFVALPIDGVRRLVSVAFIDVFSGDVEEENIRTLIERQADKPKRPVTEDMLRHTFFSEWVAEIDAVQDLIAYLDEHVPDSQNDLRFADELVESVLADAQKPDFSPEFAPYLKEYDFYATKAQVERFENLVAKALGVIPHWADRGWALNEAHDISGEGQNAGQGSM